MDASQQPLPVTDPEPSDQAVYRLSVEPVNSRIRVQIDGQVVADSSGVRAMDETYLPTQYYFPKGDLNTGLLAPSSLRTFCPFKGTAHYWHLQLSGRTIENGAWSYENALHEAKGVGGLVAFDPNVVEEYLTAEPLPRAEGRLVANGPLIDWLLRRAGRCRTMAELTEDFAGQLTKDGMPLWRLNVNIWTLHPELAGKRYTWVRDDDGVVEGDTPYGVLQDPVYLNSPVRYVTDGLGGVRQRLNDDDPEFQFPILEDLRAGGGTDYVAMPLPFSDGQIHTMTLATQAPEGFSTAHLGQVFECITALSRYYEVLTLRRNTIDLFDTYLGQRTRRKVLGGLTHRGDGEDVRAAILFCDMRNSTGLAEALSREDYLELLNEFFERVTEPVLERGGEVLKFIGDAVLAIFPLEEDGDADADKACQLARAAAQDIVSRIAAAPMGSGRHSVHCAVGLHFGDVMYGNVGAPKRLDFTVIGSAANVAARLSAKCKELDQSLLLSGEVAKRVPDDLKSVGRQDLRHIAKSVEVFCVTERSQG